MMSNHGYRTKKDCFQLNLFIISSTTIFPNSLRTTSTITISQSIWLMIGKHRCIQELKLGCGECYVIDYKLKVRLLQKESKLKHGALFALIKEKH